MTLEQETILRRSQSHTVEDNHSINSSASYSQGCRSRLEKT